MNKNFNINQALNDISEASKNTFDINDIVDIKLSDEIELPDGSTISRAGNEFHTSKTIAGTTYTNTFRVTDKGETVTTISTDIFDGSRNDGLPSSSIHYDYFEENGVERVRLVTHSTLDNGSMPHTTKHKSITEETMVEDKAAFLDSFSQPIALVGALYSQLPAEEKLELEAETNPELQKIRNSLEPSGTSFADRLVMERDMAEQHIR